MSSTPVNSSIIAQLQEKLANAKQVAGQLCFAFSEVERAANAMMRLPWHDANPDKREACNGDGVIFRVGTRDVSGRCGIKEDARDCTDCGYSLNAFDASAPAAQPDPATEGFPKTDDQRDFEQKHDGRD